MNDETFSFVVRVWRETAETVPPSVSEGSDLPAGTWRGWIESVGNGQRLYFQDLQSAMHFIQESAGIKTTNRLSWLRHLVDRLKHD